MDTTDLRGAAHQVIEVVRELPVSPSGAVQVLVRLGEQYYVVSSVVALFSGFETLVFAADESGEVTDWEAVAGGRGMNREEAMASLFIEKCL